MCSAVVQKSSVCLSAILSSSRRITLPSKASHALKHIVTLSSLDVALSYFMVCLTICLYPTFLSDLRGLFWFEFGSLSVAFVLVWASGSSALRDFWSCWTTCTVTGAVGQTSFTLACFYSFPFALFVSLLCTCRRAVLSAVDAAWIPQRRSPSLQESNTAMESCALTSRRNEP